jgi:DNA modification methylase
MASVRQFGVALPVLVDAVGVIIAGEAITEAARLLGLTHIPVIIARDWTPAQVRAFRLAANRLAELGTWDDELLAIELEGIIEIAEVPIEILGWETAEIDLLLDDNGAGSGQSNDPADSQIAIPSASVSRSGDLWHLGEHRLLCGSTLEGANWQRLLGGQNAAMAFTDAPYNVSVNGHVCGLGRTQHAEFAMASGEMSRDEFLRFLTDAIGPMAGATRDGGLLYLCIDWRHLDEMLAAIAACGLSLINLCVWNKNNGGMGSLYRSKHELVLIAKKGTAPHTNNVELGRHGRYRTNVWDYPGVNSFGKTRMDDLADHPTVKPVALVADAIRDVTKPGEIVLDGFMGSGTTILAAERTKRIACGIEIEPAYVDVAIRRWEKLTGRPAVLSDTGESFAELAASRLAELPEAA